MPRYHTPTPLDAKQLRDIANALRHFAARYDDLAAQVDGLGEPLQVTHWISLQDALKEVNKHVSAAFLAYGESVVTRGSTSAARRVPTAGKSDGNTAAKVSARAAPPKRSSSRSVSKPKRS